MRSQRRLVSPQVWEIADINDGLIGYYKLNESVAGPVINEVGTDAVNYGAQINQQGAFGTSYNFNRNSRIQIPTTISGLSEFSISWYAITDVYSSPNTYFGGWNVNSWYIRIQNDYIEVGLVTNENGRTTYAFSNDSQIATWEHFVFKWKSGESPTLFVDKIEYTHPTIHTGTLVSGATEVIGALTGAVHSFNGRMDEIRFYNKKIDIATINSL